MIKEIIQTGKSVDLAIEDGCRALGVSREEAEFEIIDLPKKTLFGLKTLPARVRVYIELPDEKPAKAADRAETVPQKPRPPKAERPERPERASRPPRAEAGPRNGAEPVSRQEEAAIEPDQLTAAKGEAVAAYIKSVLTAMGVSNAQVTPRYTANGAYFTLSGPDLGVVIGRRGETLDALQYLSGLVANRMEGDYLRVTIDSGNYREKRERTLEALARKLALSAVRTGKSCTLEPMNPYERRIIHATVSQIRGAASASIGEEPNRRVVIKSTVPPRGGKGGGPGGGSGNNRRRGKGGGKGGPGRPPRPEGGKPAAVTGSELAAQRSTVAPPKPAEPAKPLAEQGAHLYGKIEL